MHGSADCFGCVQLLIILIDPDIPADHLILQESFCFIEDHSVFPDFKLCAPCAVNQIPDGRLRLDRIVASIRKCIAL